jgi:hypothetical protein
MWHIRRNTRGQQRESGASKTIRKGEDWCWKTEMRMGSLAKEITSL